MKALLTAAILLVSLSGCWDDGKDKPEQTGKTSSEFMSNLTKCENDCRITKPFLGGSKAKGEADGP